MTPTRTPTQHTEARANARPERRHHPPCDLARRPAHPPPIRPNMASTYLARASTLTRSAFTVASGGFAGSVSAVTGLGGAVVFIPALSKLGYEARHIVGTAVVAVTGATSAGAFAYAQNGVSDVPAAVTVGCVGAACTPIGQIMARRLSGKTLRKMLGGALILCSPSAMLKKHAAETEESDDAKKDWVIKIDRPAPTNTWEIVRNQFLDRHDRWGGWIEAIKAEREFLALGAACGLLQGTVGVGGGVLVSAYLTGATDMEVHRICGTALLATVITNLAVSTAHFRNGNVKMRSAALLAGSAMACSYLVAKNVSMQIPESQVKQFIVVALISSGVSMLK